MSAPHHKRRQGRPSTAEGMNILHAEIEDVAEAIKLRIIARSGDWEVHAGPDGSVYMDQPACPRYAKPLPDLWLVGTYTGKAPVSVIEDDLVARLREIQARRAA